MLVWPFTLEESKAFAELISSLIVDYKKFTSMTPTSDVVNDSPGCEIIKTSICNTSYLKKRRVSTTDLTRSDDDVSRIISSNVQKTKNYM